MIATNTRVYDADAAGQIEAWRTWSVVGAWTLAVVWWGLGDFSTTAVLWGVESVVERTPLVVWIVESFGHAGHAAFKALVLTGTYLVVSRVPWFPVRVVVPFGVFVAGFFLTLSNLLVVVAVYA